jgi:hypothetical protein
MGRPVRVCRQQAHRDRLHGRLALLPVSSMRFRASCRAPGSLPKGYRHRRRLNVASVGLVELDTLRQAIAQDGKK